MNGGTGYSLLYLAKQTEYDHNLPMIQQMVNSFHEGNNGGGGSSGSTTAATASGSGVSGGSSSSKSGNNL